MNYSGAKEIIYKELVKKQGPKCAVCGLKQSDICDGRFRGNARLQIDHDHATGTVRGLLCNRCNVILGYAQDNVGYLQKLIQYLQGGK